MVAADVVDREAVGESLRRVERRAREEAGVLSLMLAPAGSGDRFHESFLRTCANDDLFIEFRIACGSGYAHTLSHVRERYRRKVNKFSPDTNSTYWPRCRAGNFRGRLYGVACQGRRRRLPSARDL